MTVQDPIHNFTLYNNTSGHADAILDKLRIAALAAGWIVNEWDTFPAIGTTIGGRELYLRTNAGAGLSQHSFFSLKAHMGQGADHTGIAIYANTGYSPSFRVDNQPGMFARHGSDILNAALWTEIFSGLWDNGGPNGDPLDTGKYKTPGGAVPFLQTNKAHFTCRNGGTLDKLWFIQDTSARVLAALWYVDNVLQCLVIGKIYYDDEGVAPSNFDGQLLAGWAMKYDDRLLLNPPINDSLGGERTSAAADSAPFAMIRNRTVGGVTFPSGTPTGTPFFQCGTVVKSFDRIEATDNLNQVNSSAGHRPDQTFGATHNNLQAALFPNPKLTIHYEALAGSQNRRAVARHRRISRWPNGGALAGAYPQGQGSVDWADSRYGFPWYFVPTAGLNPGDIITNGTRRYLVFPGNRGGVDPFASHRWAGIGFRLTDI